MIGTVIGLYLLSQSLGFYSKFAFIGYKNIYPYDLSLLLIPEAVTNYSTLIFVLSILFLLLAVADYWIFIYHPFELNIVIDFEGRNRQERIHLD